MKFNSQKVSHEARVDDTLKIADEWLQRNDDLIYCANESMFYLYQDGYYQPKMDIQVKRFLLDSEEFIYLSPHKLNHVMDRIAILTQRTIDEFNNQEIMNFENGILNLKTMEFEIHNKKYLSTIRIPYRYDPKAVCPVWHKFLRTALENDSERINVLQEFMGYCLGKDNSFHKALILLGEGRNGKGTTFYVIQKLVGDDNCSALKLGDMKKQENLSALVNKLVNVDGDTDASAIGFESDFRRITAGDAVTAKRLYKDPFMFTPHCKLIVGANDLPRIADKAHGFYDRLIVIPYNVSFYGREDKTLKTKLQAEISGIFNWAMEGRKRLYEQQNFSIPKSLEKIVKDIKKENNPVEYYIDENVGHLKGVDTRKDHLYENYKKWCKESGHHPLAMAKFGKEFYRIMRDYTGKIDRQKTGERKPIWTNIYIKNGPYIQVNEDDIDWSE